MFNSFYLLYSCNQSLKRSLQGVKKRLGHAQIDLLQEFNSKFPTSIPTPYIWESAPGSKRVGEWYDLPLHRLQGSLEGGEKKKKKKPCSLLIGKLIKLDSQKNTKFPNHVIKRANEINWKSGVAYCIVLFGVCCANKHLNRLNYLKIKFKLLKIQ